jgi:hypothetical protein
MKGLLITFLFLFSILNCFSQGLFNNGALIVIQSGAMVKVDGDINGNFTNSTGTADGKIDINGKMQVDGNWMNNTTLGGHVFINIGTNGTVELVGTTQQWVGGNTFTDFENLTLNNATGAQMMVDVNRVNGTLTLTNGALRLNNFTLIQNNTSATSITRTNGYILSESEASKLQWNIGTNIGNYTYPFGVSSAYIPFIASISLATGTSMTVSTWHTGTDNVVYPTVVTNMNDGTGNIAIPNVADRFWVPLFSGYTANFRFTYDNYSSPDDIGLLSEANLLAQYWDGIGWILPLAGVNDFSNDNVNSVPGLSGPWVLTDINGPLPVKLLSFDAKCRNNEVIAAWSTATETNNDFFTLESSVDAQHWNFVANIDGAGNSNDILNYQYTDVKSSGGLSYYRLRQTDFDGRNEVFSPVSVICSDDNLNNISIYPNPFKEELIIKYSNLNESNAKVMVYDMLGKVILENEINASTGTDNYILDLSKFADGLYYVGFTSGNIEYHQRVVKN